MRVSSAKFILTNGDLMSILKDYVKVEGLNFKSVEIGQFITVEGDYKKVVTIPFKATLGIGTIKDNILNIKILNVKVYKLGVLSPIKNFALKKSLSSFEKYGIKVEKDNIAIDLNEIPKLVPYFYFNLKDIVLQDSKIEVELDNVSYDENKESIYEEEEPKCNVEDGYLDLRNGIVDSVPDKYKDLVEYAMLIPDIIALLWRLLRDRRVEKSIKVKVLAIIGYLAMPFDIIPDFIPLIGKIDDVAIALYGLNTIINDVPHEIIIENWQGDKDIITVVQEGVKYISILLGSENVAKLLATIKNLFAKKENKSYKKKYAKK